MQQKKYSRKNLFLTALVFACALASLRGACVNSGESPAGAGLVTQSVIMVNVKPYGGISAIESLATAETYLHPVKKAAPPAAVSASGKPRLVIEDREGNSLFEMEFSYPKVMTIPPSVLETADGIPAVLPIDSPEISLIVPDFPDAHTIHVFDAGSESPSSSMPAGSAPPSSNLGASAPPVPAPAQQGKLNVLIMASGYNSSNMSNFQARATVIKNALAGAEPFATYADQVNINAYNNTADLGCYSGCSGIDRLMCCNSGQVVSAATSSGYSFDEIIVVHNTGTYAGGGYRGDDYKTNSYNTYCAVYDGDYSAVMALHEFGHSFGDLCDEYSYGSEGYTYANCVNCRASCNDWSAYTSGCQLGCDAKPSYYRPENSVMLSLSYTTFNQASIEATYLPDGLQKRIQFFVGTVGSLVVHLSPQAAVTAGAKWKMDGGAWQDSGTTISNLTAGTHTVDFATVKGYLKPASETVRVGAGGVTSIERTYNLDINTIINTLILD